MTPRIRPAEPSDVSGIQAVARAAWRAAHVPIVGEDAVLEFLGEHYDEDSIRARIERQEQLLRVAVDDGTILGFALASRPDEGDTFRLSQLYVTPDHWGEGIGSALLASVEHSVDERGGERLKLRVMVENDRAVNFYEEAGFTRAKTIYDDQLDVESAVYEKPIR